MDNDSALVPLEFHGCWMSSGWKNPKKYFRLFDANHNGTVSYYEFFALDRFDSVDLGSSSTLTPDEIRFGIWVRA